MYNEDMDKDFIDDVRQVINELNSLLNKCANFGIQVEINVHDLGTFEDTTKQMFIEAKFSRIKYY